MTPQMTTGAMTNHRARADITGREEQFLHFLFDTRCLTSQIAQVVELRAADIAATLDRYSTNRRAVRLEHTLDALTVRNLAHGERRIESAVAARDDDAFVGLHTLTIAFLHLHFHDDRVAGREVR